MFRTKIFFLFIGKAIKNKIINVKAKYNNENAINNKN